MFMGAVISLLVAVLSALLGYGGVPDALMAGKAQHVFLIAMGVFAMSSMATILDIELLRGDLFQLIKHATVRAKEPPYVDTL